MHTSFSKILLFEIRYRLGRWDTYIYFIAFFIFSFYSIVSSTVFTNYGGAGQRVFANSTNTISYFISTMSIWLIAIAAALMSVPVMRDRETKTGNFFFALPISKAGYLFGRFLGTLVILIFISLAVLMGIVAGYMMPGHDPVTLQPFRAVYFLHPYAVLILSNLLIFGLIFYSMVTITRHVMGGYMTAILIIALNMFSARFYDPNDMTLFTWMDPYGSNAFLMVTRGWSIMERNTRLVPFESWLLQNRLFWLCIGLVLFAFSYFRFSFGRWMTVRPSRKRKFDLADKLLKAIRIPLAKRSFTTADNFRHLLHQTALELRYNLRNVFFLVIVSAAAFMLFYASWTVNNPTTSSMLEIKEGYFSIFALVILVFFAGEAVNRERELKMSHITDTLPVPDWVFTGSKLLSVLGIAFLLSVIVFTAMVLPLLVKHVAHIAWDAYLIESFLIIFPYYALLAVLSFSVQVLVKNKFLGHVIMILFFILNIIAKSIGIEHNLLFYGAPPKPMNGPLSGWAGFRINYSDMNGYAPFAGGRFWFTLYWCLFALALLVVINLLWKRGVELNFRERLALMRRKMNKRAGFSLALFLLLFAGAGAYIFYNTNILNEYLPQTSQVPFERRAIYEKKYSRYASAAAPWITNVDINAEFYPSDRNAELRVSFLTENRSGKTIDTLFVSLPEYFVMEELSVRGVKTNTIIRDDVAHFYACTLPQGIQPGEKKEIQVKGHIRYRGFMNETGTDVARFSPRYMYLTDIDLPWLGYNPRYQVTGAVMRKQFGLPEDIPGYNISDSAALYRNVWSPVSDWVHINVTIGTAADHTAIAPGYLQKQWEKDGRRYFTYSTGEQRIPYGMEIFSGVFAKQVKKIDSTTVELYAYEHHMGHADSLFSKTTQYLGYLHRHGGKTPLGVVRYVEMPYNLGSISEDFMQYAFERGNTYPDFMDNRASGAVMNGFFGDALAPAAAKGNSVYGIVRSTMSSAAIRERYPDYTYNRMYHTSVDNYLTGRSAEKNMEHSVAESYASPYMLEKTGVAMGATRMMIGEEKYQQLLSGFRNEHAYQGPPYLSGAELLNYLRPHIPDSLKTRFDDAFYKIILYKNRIVKVDAQPDGKRFKINITLDTKKMQDDGTGNLTTLPQDEYIDLGIFTAAGRNMQLADVIVPVKVHAGVNNVTVYTEAPPSKVIIDPYYVLMNMSLLSGQHENYKDIR